MSDAERESRYAEAIRLGVTKVLTEPSPDYAITLQDRLTAGIVEAATPLLDAEAAAAVSEAQAEGERMVEGVRLLWKVDMKAAREAEAEVERLHSWDGLLSLLDEHWPEGIFPTSADGRRDTGPRLVAAIRRAKSAEAEVERLRALVGDEDQPGWGRVSRAEAIRQANEFHAGQLRWIDGHDKRRDERDALREGIRALADEFDTAVGFRGAATSLRALLAPSPAATTGEADPRERIEGTPVWGRTNGLHAPVRIHPSEESARAAAADPCKGGQVVVFRSAENGWEEA